VDSRGTPTSRRQRRSFEKTAIRKSGRWHGPCNSSGTTTNGQGNHTLMKVPKKCARTRKLPPWVGSRTPIGGILALQRGEDVKLGMRGGGRGDNETIDCSLFRRHSGCPYVCTWGSLLRGLCGRRGFPRAEGGTCVASGGAYFSFTTRRRRRAGRLVRLGRRRSLSHISVRVQQGPAAGRSPRSAPWNISVTTLTIVRRESPRRR